MTFSQAQTAVVVDASAAVAFLNDDGGWAVLWHRWASSDALLMAPAHFPAEVGNALLRSARLTALEAANRLERLFASGIETTDRGLAGILAALELADRYGLTVYDALYLHLAIDIDAELATLDRDLARAATAEGVAVSG
jgi:predicted nucleic acid-binding protein